MEKVSESDTNNCLTAEELKNAGTGKRIGASGFCNSHHKLVLYERVFNNERKNIGTLS